MLECPLWVIRGHEGTLLVPKRTLRGPDFARLRIAIERPLAPSPECLIINSALNHYKHMTLFANLAPQVHPGGRRYPL